MKKTPFLGDRWRVRFPMKYILSAAVVILLASGSAARSESPPVKAQEVPVTVEYYYRIKWGSAEDFKQLYNKNHAPLLEEMKKLGFIRSMRVDEPFTHMAGGPRWDLRVTIVFRDAAAAVSDPEWDRLWGEARLRMYSDKSRFDAEEKARFGLLEDHWDIIVNEVKKEG